MDKIKPADRDAFLDLRAYSRHDGVVVHSEDVGLQDVRIFGGYGTAN